MSDAQIGALIVGLIFFVGFISFACRYQEVGVTDYKPSEDC